MVRNAEVDREESALVDAWRAGDQRAGEQLFERYFDSIYAFFASKITSDVSDLVQRTFLGCLEARERFRAEASFRTFLFAIARHELYGFFRQRARGAQLDFHVTSLEALGPGPSSMLRAEDERSLLVLALRRVPLELQLILEMRFWHELSGPELAIALDIPEGTVRSRLRRGIEKLRGELDAARAPSTAASMIDRWEAALAAET